MLYPEDYENETTQQPQSRFWGWTMIGWLIFTVLLFGSITYAFAAEEPVIARASNDYIRLTHDLCTPNLPGYRTGEALLDGQKYKLCWRLVRPQEGPIHVVLVYEDGDTWRVDPKKFGPESKNPAGI